MLEISAVTVILILVIKEFLSVKNRTSRIANFLYLPVLPLLVLFGIAAYEKISQIPL